MWKNTAFLVYELLSWGMPCSICQKFVSSKKSSHETYEGQDPDSYDRVMLRKKYDGIRNNTDNKERDHVSSQFDVRSPPPKPPRMKMAGVSFQFVFKYFF
jgi:hypothetical protein